MDDHHTDDCLVRRLCSLCRRRHNQWVHVPEDDVEVAFVTNDAEDEEPEYEWVYEPGLTGECLGEGFLALEDPEDADEEDELHYAYAAFEAAAVGEGEPLRRSARNRGRPPLNYQAMARGQGAPPPTAAPRPTTPGYPGKSSDEPGVGFSYSRFQIKTSGARLCSRTSSGVPWDERSRTYRLSRRTRRKTGETPDKPGPWPASEPLDPGR